MGISLRIYESCYFCLDLASLILGGGDIHQTDVFEKVPRKICRDELMYRYGIKEVM